MEVTDLLFILNVVSAVGCGTIAGVFFAFSNSVMQALGELPDAQGAAAMQSVNRIILNPWFLGAFLGTALSSAVTFVLAWKAAGPQSTAWTLAGAFLYVLGSFAVTVVFNVPLNEKLARARPDASETAVLWRQYLAIWTKWNHVRTGASLAAAVCFTIACGMSST